MAFWVYILRCADESYYVGHTEDLELRVAQHQAGNLGGYTKTRRPVQLVYSESFGTRDDAFAAERQIKGWSRQKKAALIAGNWERLRMLAQRAHPQHDRNAVPSGRSPFESLRVSGRPEGEDPQIKICRTPIRQ